MSLNDSKQWKLLNVHVRKTKYKQKAPYTNCSKWKLFLLSIVSFSYSSKSSLTAKIKIKAEFFLHNYRRYSDTDFSNTKIIWKNEWSRNRHPSTKQNHLYGLPAASASPKIAASSWQKSVSSLKGESSSFRRNCTKTD